MPIIAAREIAEALARHPDDAAFVQAGTALLEGQQAAARDARDTFFQAWDKLDRKKAAAMDETPVQGQDLVGLVLRGRSFRQRLAQAADSAKTE